MSSYKYDIDRHVNPAWEATDEYLSKLFIKPDEALDTAFQSHKTEEIPAINVSPLQGVLLYQFAKMQSYGGTRAINILEIGTLAGYSTIWLSRAARECGGKVTSLEFEPKHAEVAQRNLQRDGLTDVVRILVGDARETLKTLVGDGQKYDLIFIDADKPAYTKYWQASMKLSKPGTIIIGDNVIRQGGIADPDNNDARVVGVRDYLELAAREPGVTSTCVQTVNGKGWDGYSIHYVQ